MKRRSSPSTRQPRIRWRRGGHSSSDRFLPRAVIFDCDGTLADTESLAVEAVQAQLAPLSYALTGADLIALRGRSLADVHAYLAMHVAGLPDRTTFEARCISRELELFPGCVPWPDARKTLIEATTAGLSIGIASMSLRRTLDVTLRAIGVSHLVSASVAGDEAAPKPSPDSYLQVAHRLGVAPSDCIAVEDSSVGIASALAAEMPVVAIDRHAAARLHATLVVRDLTLAALTAAWQEWRSEP